MSKIEVNTITQQCGPSLTVGGGACKSVTLDATTVTLGRCGATVSLAAGATQSGFGRTGTVDWCTTAKTAPFTGVSGKGYFVNTTCGAVTVTLPATPTAGDIISIADYASTWQTNNLTVCNNGSKINGDCATATLAIQGQSITLVYVDGTRGWKNTMDSTSNVSGRSYITATGGTITTCGNYKIHTFTSDGCFSVSTLGSGTACAPNTVDYLVIAGGGGGGVNHGGGGGAGGWRASDGTSSGCYTAGPAPLTGSVPGITVSATTYPISVGAGGGGGAPSVYGPPTVGSNSIFSTITSSGGGGGSANEAGGTGPFNSGGSGGGGKGEQTPTDAGTGNTPPVSPPQGNPGGTGSNPTLVSGGGGGVGGAGTNAGPAGGPGGNGVASSITGTPITKAGGGGGAGRTPNPAGSGGSGGGGPGGFGPGTPGNGTPAPANTGSGGGGGGGEGAPTGGGSGGSGIVVIRYKFQ
jgi:hypothetical protein